MSDKKTDKETIILDRSSILEAKDIKTEPLTVPEWGGKVFVKGLSGNERDAWEQRIVEARKGNTGKYDIRLLKARFVIACCVDADGKQIFNEGDVEALNLKSAKAIQVVYDVGQRLSGLSDEEAALLAGN